MQGLVKIIRGSSAVVIISGSAYIVDTDAIGSTRVGQSVYITEDALAKATPYGIDWSVLYPDGIVISVDLVQEIMYSHGLIDWADVKANPALLSQATLSIARALNAQLYQRITMEIGG